MERFDIARHHQRNAPLQPLASKPFVDQVDILAADHDGDVPCVEEDIATAELRSHRVTTSHRQRVAIGIEELTVKSPEGVAD